MEIVEVQTFIASTFSGFLTVRGPHISFRLNTETVAKKLVTYIKVVFLTGHLRIMSSIIMKI